MRKHHKKASRSFRPRFQKTKLKRIFSKAGIPSQGTPRFQDDNISAMRKLLVIDALQRLLKARMDEEWDREFLRIPGLLRRWEFEQVMEAGWEFFIDDAGCACDGTKLFAVYRRKHNNKEI